MSIASSPFLFLFLPAVLGGYYLIPGKNGLRARNLFLLLASLFFYTWGEPVYVALLVAMVLLTWLLGEMACGNRGTRTGITAVVLTVFFNLAVLLLLAGCGFAGGGMRRLSGETYNAQPAGLPVGFSFFMFSSVSYVVDLYRGHCKSSGSIVQAALYTCVFFRILQGPIVSWRKFEQQLSERTGSFDRVVNGTWRFSAGLCKKIIIADNLSLMVQNIRTVDYAGLPLGDAWLGCIAYMVCLYFDFSGYSDMAIGLAEMFGFSIPENFKYPFCSVSIAEFWRRWHITLCEWFTEYLYYPVLLGPSVRLRKRMQRYRVPVRTARTLQNGFVTGSVWLVTALWHGMNLNYLLWGLANCAGMLIETHIKQPVTNKRLITAARRAGFLLFLLLSVPLISTGSFREALLFYRAMFAGSPAFSYSALFSLGSYGLFLGLGIIGSFPVVPYLKEKYMQLTDAKFHVLWDIGAGIVLAVLVVISVSYIFTRNTPLFLYQQ